MPIAEQYKEIAEEVREACVDAGRPADGALLLAVSKTVGVEGVGEAISAGARDFGENRPEQLMEKHAAYPDVRWHFIGNIQSRRIKDIVPCAHLIHSLYQPKHARKIDEEAARIGKLQRVLVEVNVSGEESKSGLVPAAAEGFVDECLGLSNVQVCGLMTMAPQGDLAIAQECFARLRELRDGLKRHIADIDPASAEAFCELSMGMSEDWREAIVEGSTIVRVGRAIFSDNF